MTLLYAPGFHVGSWDSLGLCVCEGCVKNTREGPLVALSEPGTLPLKTLGVPLTVWSKVLLCIEHVPRMISNSVPGHCVVEVCPQPSGAALFLSPSPLCV